MSKRKDPPLKLTLPPHKECEACSGRGIPESLAYQMKCDVCGGAGRVNAETGEQLDLGIVIIKSNQAYRNIMATNRALMRELNATADEYDRYGKLPTRHGGKSRGD